MHIMETNIRQSACYRLSSILFNIKDFYALIFAINNLKYLLNIDLLSHLF